MRWLLIVLLTAVPAMAEEVTTANVTPDMSAFIASGSTQAGSGCSAGQFCTGNASNGGGTYTSSFDVPLTEAEVRRGFTVNQFVDVTSHPSNATLATCVSTTQAGDCRDIFSMTVALFDITNTVVEKWEREVELDFGGTHTFSFADEVSPNSFSILTGEFELWGIDAGFHGGAYGPQFSEPGLAFTYQDVVEQQVLEQIAQLDVEVAITLPPPTTIEPISAPAESPPPQPVQTFTALAPTAPEAPPPPPTIEQIQTAQPEPQEQQQEAEVEAAIEMEMQTQPEPQPEPEQQAEAEPEPEPEPEQQAEAEPDTEQQAEPQEVVEAEPEPEPEPEQQQAEAEPETKQEKQKAAAERVVKKIAPSQRYSAASQATTMVVMNMLAGKIATGVAVPDTQGFFPATGMADDRSMSNPLQDYTMFGGSNAAHDRLMQIEWSR